jgi:hypothetical protein
MIIKSLKTCYLVSHFGDVFVDPNLLVYHIVSPIGDFNINLLTNIIQLATLQTFMKKYNFKLTFFEALLLVTHK